MKESKRYTILVIDDEERFHQTMRDAFGHYIFVKSAFSKEQAHRILNDKSIKIDLVTLDLDLGGEGNFEHGIINIAAFRNQFPDIPVIVATKDNRINTAVEAMQNGANFYFSKGELNIPFWRDKIIEVIENHRNRKGTQELNKVFNNPITQKDQDGFIAISPEITVAKEKLKKLAEMDDMGVLLLGETGTGKEIAAKYFHNQSSRKEKPYVAINLSAIPETLLESTLFGHKKGAFSGAEKDFRGLFEEANKGVLFLDEIGDITPNIQVKLLRFLQDKKIRPVGGSEDITLDVVVIAATNKNLQEEITAKRFREDLYQRLKTPTVTLPPLRNRKEDIIPLAIFFLKIRDIYDAMSPSAVERLMTYSWKGNIRELELSLKEATVNKILAGEEKITLSCLPTDMRMVTGASMEKENDLNYQITYTKLEAIEKALIETEGKKQVAAQLLNMTGDQILYAVKSAFTKFSEMENLFPKVKKYYSKK